MVRYYSHYSNVIRGRLEKEESGLEDCYIILDDRYSKKSNKSWARLIRRIYKVDPLICPRCGGDMRIIAFIEDYKVVKKILDYLGIYKSQRKRPPPKIHTYCDEFDDYIDCDYID